jgi:tetratricopeptide (TPR) repeat protein
VYDVGDRVNRAIGDGEPPPTSPTIDAPRWLEPGAPATPSATPPASGPHAVATLHSAPTGDAAPPSSPAAALRRVAQFILLERIGAGGMGEVFSAFDDQLERKVAIKLVATQGDDERARQRLLREAQALARLNHPNVVTVYEVGALPDGGLFIAMELVRGRTLRAWQAQPRTWQDIVAIYGEAGRGLAAAHDTGIVHRDFKPDNVLVGDDGRVRVADFGIAFAAEVARSAGDPRRDAPVDPDASTVTAAGGFAGTPGYMAPEQLAGTAIDARADQFSFCVALHEALHGERPPGAPAGERPARRDPEPSYPRWLRELVQRGLARDPHARFPTMAALLAELARHRERRRRRMLAATLVGVAAIAGASSVALTGHDPPPCPLATDELTAVWDAAARQRSQAAILGTAAPAAPTMWASTATAFDRYATHWLTEQRAACEATHVRHTQSADLLDRRMECLASRRRSLAAAVDVLQHRPVQAMAHADELLGSLGDIEQCADTATLRALSGASAAVTNPLSAAARVRATEVRGQLARADALLATGDIAAAEPMVAQADRLATGFEDDAVRAEVVFHQGKLGLARGEVRKAVALLDRAAGLAVSSHHDELAADIWLTLAIQAGVRNQRTVEMEGWLSQAEGWLRRLGHDTDPRRVQADHARALLQRIGGDVRGAAATLSRAIETGEAMWGKDDPRLIGVLRERATTRGMLRDTRPAFADAERALALGIAAWGEQYPDVARTRRALGLLYIEQLRDVARGEHELARALELFRAQLDADSLEIANCEQALSQAGAYRGDYAAALEHAERADRIYVQQLGTDYSRRGEALMGVGALRFLRKDFDGSLAAYQTAYPILLAAYGPGHYAVGVLLANTGEALLALGQPEPARADFARALEILEPALGPEHLDLALPLKGLGLVELRRDRPRAAVAPLERALALLIRSRGGAPQELAEVRWALARALRAEGQQLPRARALAEEAATGYRGLGSESAGPVHEIERWLASMPR